MKIALFGLPLTGKTTIFRSFAGFQSETTSRSKSEPNRAIVRIPDARLDKLEQIYKSRRKVHSTIEYLDMPNPIGSDRHPARFPENFMAELRTTDALAYVVRVFDSPSVPHIHGDVDFIRDIKEINTDLLLSDLAVAESALDKMGHRLKVDATTAFEMRSRQELLAKCKQALENETPLRALAWKDDELKHLRNYQFLSQKPFIVILNTGEKQNGNDVVARARQLFAHPQSVLVTAICGQLEMEISQLPAEEQILFLQEMGLQETALKRFIPQCFDLLGRMYFFTVGEDESRAWEIPKNSTALYAAGVIHTDLAQGFICAEVFRYEDLLALGGVPGKLKEAGKMRLEGKEYVVEDGDILTIRFNVSKSRK
jgi:GTP-binding protein YchF